MTDHRKITRSEKKFFFVTGLAIAMILAYGMWSQWANVIPDVNFPSPKMPSPNGYDLYVRAGAAIIPANPAVDPIFDTKVVPESQWSSRYPTANKEAWLRRNATALNLFRRGLKHQSRVPLLQATPSNKSHLRHLARALVVESNARGERGDWKGAVQSTLDGLKLGHDIQNGALIDALTGYTVNSIIRRRLWEVLPYLNATEARAATQQVETLQRTRIPFPDVLRAEKYNTLSEVIASMRSGSFGRGFDILPDSAMKKFLLRRRIDQTPRRTIIHNFSSYMDALAQMAAQPYKARKAPEVPGDFYNELVAPVFKDSVVNYDRDHAANALLLASLATHAFMQDKKHYPTSLHQLVPRYLSEVPADVFGSGQALRYRFVGKNSKPVIYSLGPDAVDNGGRPIEDKSKTGRARYLVWDGKGDFVAEVNY